MMIVLNKIIVKIIFKLHFHLFHWNSKLSLKKYTNCTFPHRNQTLKRYKRFVYFGPDWNEYNKHKRINNALSYCVAMLHWRIALQKQTNEKIQIAFKIDI